MDNNGNAPLKEKTMVVYGEDKTTELILQTLDNARSIGGTIMQTPMAHNSNGYRTVKKRF